MAVRPRIFLVEVTPAEASLSGEPGRLIGAGNSIEGAHRLASEHLAVENTALRWSVDGLLGNHFPMDLYVELHPVSLVV